MTPLFRFLSTTEFEGLSHREKLTYLSDAMEEVERLKTPHDERGWNSMFTQPQQQQQPPQQQELQQQQQPQVKDEPDKPPE